MRSACTSDGTLILVILLLLGVVLQSTSASRTLRQDDRLRGPGSTHGGAVASAKAASHASISRKSSSDALQNTSKDSSRWRALLQSSSCEHCATNSCIMSGTSGSFVCTSCINGYKPNKATGSCECPAGFYPTSSDSSSSCIACPTGSYCPGTVAEPQPPGIHTCPDGMTTRAAKSSSRSDCVNAPGYYLIDSSTAVPCPTGTFSPGLKKQRLCNSCPSGYTTVQVGPATNYTACVLRPGWYMTGPGSVARCPYGKYKEGYGPVSSCTSCPTGVTTDGPEKTSATECKYLLPSYEASSVTGTQVLAAQPCRSNAYCPGTTTPGDPGYITCPNGRWTINVASTSPYQCMVPPGYSATNTTIAKCPPGSFKTGWTTADTADCTFCGDGISTQDLVEVKRYSQDGSAAASVWVAGSSGSCYVPRGWEMTRSWDSAANSYGFSGRPCTGTNQVCAVSMSDGNLFSSKCNSYGWNDTTYGLRVRPCQWCVGPVSKADAADDGYSICNACTNGLISGSSGSCEVPPGKAAADSTGTIFMSAPSSTSQIYSVVPCPANYYCPGGPANTTVPTACLVLHSDAGSTSADDCNLVPAGYATANDTTIFSFTPVNTSSITRLALCPQGYYCTGGNASTTIPTPCNSYVDTAGAGATQESDCNLSAPGYRLAAADTAEECPSGTYKEGWTSDFTCTSCGTGGNWTSVDNYPVTVYIRSGNIRTTLDTTVRGNSTSCTLTP